MRRRWRDTWGLGPGAWRPQPIGQGRTRDAGTCGFRLDWIPDNRRRGQADATRLVEIYAELDYTDQSTGRSGTVSAGPRLIENLPPSPIEARWAGGRTDGWNEVSRQFEIHLRGEGPVAIEELDAVMWHKSDPGELYPAMPHGQPSATLGHGQASIHETLRFDTSEIPEELRGRQGTPRNMVALQATVRYVDSDGRQRTVKSPIYEVVM